MSLTATRITGAAAINIGGAGTSGPAGNVVVNATMLSSVAGAVTGASTTVTGGDTVVINSTLSGLAGAGNTVTNGAIIVNGGLQTTAVTVNQAARASAADAATATTGVASTTTYNAGSAGVKAVAGSTQTTQLAAAAAVAGVTNGTVSIVDIGAGVAGATSTITTAVVNNFATGSGITSNALTNLTLATLSAADNTTFTVTNNTAGAPGALALNLNGLGRVTGSTANGAASAVGTINDVALTFVGNSYSTLNIVTGTRDSFVNLTAPVLTTMNISGTNLLRMDVGGNLPTTLTTISVSGSAGFRGDISGTAITTGFTTTSSGLIQATLNAATQSFAGSTGRNIITIGAEALVAINGGSATNDILVFNAASTTFNTTAGNLTNTNTSGFEWFGLSAASGVAAWDMSTFDSSFNTIYVNNAIANTITNAANGTSLFIQGPVSGTTGTTVTNAGTTSMSYSGILGASQSASITIGNSALSLNQSYAGITMADAAGNGIGNISIVSNGRDLLNPGQTAILGSTSNVAGAINTIVSLATNTLSNLTVTGAAGLALGTVDGAAGTGITTVSPTLTIASNQTGLNGTFIGQINGANTLETLNFTGSNKTTVFSLNTGTTVTGIDELTISNTGTGSVKIGVATTAAAAGARLVNTNLDTLNINGNVEFYGTLANSTTQIQGVTVNAGTNNAYMDLIIGAADAANENTITLGNNNNKIVDQTVVGTVSITTGTGYNNIDVSTGAAATYSATVNLGANVSNSTQYDLVSVSVNSGQAAGYATTIRGVTVGDVIDFTLNVATTLVTFTSTQTANLAAAANAAGAIALAFDYLGANQVASFVYGGNTYVANEQAANSAVQLIGQHTIGLAAATAANNDVIVLS